VTTETPATAAKSNVGWALLWATAFTIGLYAVVFLVALAFAWPHDTNPNGQCEGIGWGCTLPPRDSVQFFGVIGLPFAALAAGIAWVLVLFAQLAKPLKRWPGIALGGTAAALVMATGVAIVAINFLAS
jgi:hypothetical protein